MNADERRAELKRFLRQRRAAVTPAEVGLRTTSRRRTIGLRREDVASIADVGVTWYTWLEQGRDIQVSRETLDRIAHALRLSPSDRRYLFELAGPPPIERVPDDLALDPRLQLVVDSVGRCPAFVVDPRWDVIVFNQLADQIFDFDGYAGPFPRNHLWRGFLDPRRKRLYVEWQRIMDLGVALLRSHYASRVGEPRFAELVAALKAASAEFAASWERRQTAPLEVDVRLRLASRLGPLALYSMRFPIAERPGYLLFILPPADEASAAILAGQVDRPLTTPARPR
jgi:transcriptional regulator with XRE-family HTH domain